MSFLPKLNINFVRTCKSPFSTLFTKLVNKFRFITITLSKWFFYNQNSLNLSAQGSGSAEEETTEENNMPESRSQWVQVSGHPGSCQKAGFGKIWKQCNGNAEQTTYEILSLEASLKGIVPKYFRKFRKRENLYIELEDLLHTFQDPNVMDIKMGTRTFLETEVTNPALREDLYRKMIYMDMDAPSALEHEQQAVTKLRYMLFREDQSSSNTHGFRIEAMKLQKSIDVIELKKVKIEEDVVNVLTFFLKKRQDLKIQLVAKLENMRSKLEKSHFLKKHEVIGSSLLIIYDQKKIGAWLIDFAKTRPLPEGTVVTHRSPWILGNKEDGILYGFDNLIEILKKIDLTSADLQKISWKLVEKKQSNEE